VPGVTQKVIPSGGKFTYQFTVTPEMVGTHLYHTHVNDDFQMDQGLHGVLIVDPSGAPHTHYDQEAVYEMSSFKAGLEGEEENTFAFNGKAFPESPVLNVALGSRVLLRLVNASAEQSHVMHLHGYTFQVVALDGNPLEHPYKANTVLLGPSQTADVAFKADRPGQWMFQCHFLDHVMNPVSREVRDEMREDRAICPMGGLVTFVNVAGSGKVSRDFLPAGSITRDPTCSPLFSR
jgi:FtsP/CotA-like multicopper oxidase with cupredoxin domain